MKKRGRQTVGISIRTKLILVTSLLLIIPVLVLGSVSYYVSKAELESSGKIILKNSVKMTLLFIDEQQNMVDEGKLTLEEAQEHVREFMLGKKQTDGTRPINKDFNLGANGYLLAYTQDGIEAAHPKLEGQNVWTVTDKTGLLLVQEQVRVGNQEEGGFLTYFWNLPNSDAIAEKITYQKTDPNWNWVVSAGSYMSDFNAGSGKIFKLTLIVLAAVLLLGFTVIYLFARHIAVPVKKMSKAVDVMASGDLTPQDLRIKNRDEIGSLYRSFTRMIENFNQLISSVKTSALTVSESSDELNKVVGENTKSLNQVSLTVEEIAKSSTEQANETQKGAEKVKNLAERIEYVTELSVNTDATAASTADMRVKGLEAIELVSDKSEENRKAAEIAGNIILEVDKNSIEIGTIAEAISEISNQTNLLSLNAAIEAARAGEQGKGFAVVADEIRKLASQTAVLASKVNELIDGIQSKSKTAVKAMEQGKNLANEENKAVIVAKSIFSDILKAIDKMAEDVERIKNYSLEMETQKNELVSALENLFAATEENSAATEEVSASTTQQLQGIGQIASNTEKLKELADELKKTSDSFKV